MKTFTTASLNRINRFSAFAASMLLITFMVSSAVYSQASPPTVNLGTSGSFVILAKTGITTTGATAVTGDLGISPSAATSITGFGLIMDQSGTFASSSLVTGKVYAADYTAPTPTKMTTGIGDMETAYTNAAGRTSPDFVELHAGDITGKTLTRGLYKWGTAVAVGAGGVTISGSSTDIWIFQVAQNLNIANGAKVTLIGGAKSTNIFWQVAGQVSVGTTAELKGIILCKTAIIMNTGASLDGRALAQTAVSLDANAITTSANTSAAEATAVSPNQFDLLQNYPNPFNPSTSIGYQLPSAGHVSLIVYDAIGQIVATLVNGHRDAGTYSVSFNTIDGSHNLSSGVYYYRLEAGSFVSTKKLVHMK